MTWNLADLRFEVLTEFVDASVHADTTCELWKQCRVPTGDPHLRRIENTKQKRKERARKKDELAEARREQDARVKAEARRMTERYIAKDSLGADRALCHDCKRRMPGTGWCPAHTGVPMPREKLKDERPGLVHHFTIIAKDPNSEGVKEIKGYIRTGTYENGKLGEVFMKVGKAGEEEAWTDSWSITASLALQYGVPVDVLFKKLEHQRFDPFGASKNKDIPRCSSLIDYVSKWILQNYGEAAAVSTPEVGTR